MGIALHEEMDGKLLTIELSGKLVKADYLTFVPEVERYISNCAGKIDVLVLMHNFHGWDFPALWEDLKFDMKHFRDIRRLALVGETKWEKWMATFCKPFTKAEVQYFDTHDEAKARHWVHQKDDMPVHAH